LTPHNIGIGQEVTLISSTLHVLKVFTTPIMSFQNTLECQKTTMLIGLQTLSQVELVEVVGVEFVEEVVNQPIIEDQSNLGL